MVATAREVELGPQDAGRIAELGRYAETMRVSLRGFDESDLATLVADVAGQPVTADLVRSVVEATEGNAFFAEEMITHLVDSGLAGAQTLQRGAGVPARIRDTLGRRLASLTDDGINLLLAGSVVGREFDVVVAGAAFALSGIRLVDAADDGILSGLVSETGPGKLSFSHALVQEAVRERLSYARAAVIHRSVAESLESLVATRPEIVIELARHWAAVACVDPSASATAATWAVQAGDFALAAAAADEAIARYEEASQLWASSSHGHTDTLIRLGMALQHRGRADDADERFRQALLLARGLGDGRLQARAAIGLGRRYPYWETDSDRTRVLEDALGNLPDDENLLRMSLMGLLVTQLINGFAVEEAARRDELAEGIAQVLRDPAADETVLAALGQTRVYDCIEDPASLRQVAERLVTVAERRNDLRSLAIARFSQALAAIDLGDMDALEKSSRYYDEAAEQLDDPRELSQAATVRSTIAYVEGRYDDAARLSEEALQFGRASGDYNADLVYYAQGLLRAVDHGQAAELMPVLLAATEYQTIPTFAAGTILVAAMAGDTALARQRLDAMVAVGPSAFPRGADRISTTAFLAHACVLVNAVDLAPALRTSLSSERALVVRIGPLIGWWGPIDHHLGLLCNLVGDSEAAADHFRRAIALEESMDARAFLARSKSALAPVLRQLGRPEEARELASQAAALADELGASGLSAEVGANLGR
jgi:tetratricopeptide (TPR) repeat protein